MKTKKAKATEQKLFDAAVALFSKNGFEGTTMRAIADEAGVATGAAYYYFKSKDDVVQRLYQETLEGDAALIESLQRESDKSKRVEAYVVWKIEQLAPYHAAVGALVGRVLTPRTGLSPFGANQALLRERDMNNFAALIAGEDDDAGRETTSVRASALWMLWMSVLFLWLHDEHDDRNARAEARFGTMANTLMELPDGMLTMAATMMRPLWVDAA